MGNEGFVIPLDDVLDKEKVVEEKIVEVQADKKVEETKEEKPTVKVEETEDDGLLVVDTGPKKEEIVEEEKEETKVEETDDKSKTGEETDDTKETESPSILHATALKEVGLLPNLDIEKLEGLSDEEVIKATIDGTQDEIERTVKEITSQQTEAYQQFIEVLDSGGDLEEYARIKASQKRFDGVTAESLEENEEMAKNIITEDMKNRDFDDAEILETIEDLVEKDKLTPRAVTSLGRLNKRDKAREDKLIADTKQSEVDQKAQRVETLKKIDTTLEAVKEIIPGIPVTSRERQTMKRLMTVPAETKDGVPISRAQQIRAEDPVRYEAILAYYIGIGLFDKEPAWDKVMKRAKTDITKKILKKVRDNQKHTPGKTPPKPTDTKDDIIIMPNFD